MKYKMMILHGLPRFRCIVSKMELQSTAY